MPISWLISHCFCFLLANEVTLQLQLLDPDRANTEVDDGFLSMLSDLASTQWPFLAAVLSYTNAEIEEALMNESPAQSLLQRWKQHTQSTYGYLDDCLKAPFMLPSFFIRARQSGVAQPTMAFQPHDVQLFTNVGKKTLWYMF